MTFTDSLAEAGHRITDRFTSKRLVDEALPNASEGNKAVLMEQFLETRSSLLINAVGLVGNELIVGGAITGLVGLARNPELIKQMLVRITEVIGPRVATTLQGATSVEIGLALLAGAGLGLLGTRNAVRSQEYFVGRIDRLEEKLTDAIINVGKGPESQKGQ